MANTNVTDKLNKVLGVAKGLLDESDFSMPEELVAMQQLTQHTQQTMPTVTTPQTRLPRVKATEDLHPVPANPPSYDNDLENDYYHARQVLRGLVSNAELTLDSLLCIAQDMQHPRAYEVAGQLINTISSVTKELMNLHKTMKEIKTPPKDAGGGNMLVEKAENVQNNTYVFNGTTADLQKMIREQIGRNT